MRSRLQRGPEAEGVGSPFRAPLRRERVGRRRSRVPFDLDRWRDRLDRTRAISPLAPAPDAHVIDSSDMDAEGVVDEICAIALRPSTPLRMTKGE